MKANLTKLMEEKDTKIAEFEAFLQVTRRESLENFMAEKEIKITQRGSNIQI